MSKERKSVRPFMFDWRTVNRIKLCEFTNLLEQQIERDNMTDIDFIMFCDKIIDMHRCVGFKYGIDKSVFNRVSISNKVETINTLMRVGGFNYQFEILQNEVKIVKPNKELINDIFTQQMIALLEEYATVTEESPISLKEFINEFMEYFNKIFHYILHHRGDMFNSGIGFYNEHIDRSIPAEISKMLEEINLYELEYLNLPYRINPINDNGSISIIIKRDK